MLTADHGVSSLPELTVPRTGRGGRIWLGDIVNNVDQTLRARFNADFGLEFDNGLVYADVEALRAHHVDVDSLSRVIVRLGRQRQGVRAGFTMTDVATSPDSAAVRWRRTLPASLGYVAAFAAAPDFIWSTGKSTAEHGTPNAMDLWVPISFVGAGVVPGRYPRLVRTVDIAPTLALMLGLTPSERLDGSPLREIVKGGEER